MLSAEDWRAQYLQTDIDINEIVLHTLRNTENRVLQIEFRDPVRHAFNEIITQ